MSVHRVVLGMSVILGAFACSESGIEAPQGVAMSGGGSANTTPTTTGSDPTSAANTTGGSDAASTGGPTTGSTTTSSSTGTTTTTGIPTTTSTSGGTTMGSTTGATTDGAGGAMGSGGATSDGGDTNTNTNTDGNAFGGSANDDSGADTTSSTTGAGGQTSSDQCRVMLGDVPVCCTPQGENRSNVDEVFELLNAYRLSQGRDALALDPILEEAMQGHCMHMDQADFFDHYSPVDELYEPWDRATLCGTQANAENIAWNQQSPAAVMEAWQNSSGHNQNMLSNNSTRVGIGEYNLYWGQIFGP